MDDLNLRVVAVRFQTRRGYDNPVDLDRRVDATKQAMRMAYRLGAPCVINQIGAVPEVDAEALNTGQADAHEIPESVKKWHALRSVLDELGRFGTHVGAFLAAETGAEPGPTLARLLDLDSAAHVAVCLNPGQLIVNRHPVPEAVRTLGDRIRCVAAVDGVLDLAAGRGLTVPIGQGIADFPHLFGLLEDFQFQGPVVVGRAGMDPNSAAGELRDSLAYLKELAPG